jgi:hypothetical protein
VSKTPGVTADVESICAKCGDVWHVVVAKVGDKIAKVQCKQCGAVHRWKPPGGAPAKTAARSTPSARAPKVAKASAAPVARVEEPAVAPDLSKPAKAYRAGETFTVGERVDHPSFGRGVVEVVAPGKVTVFFPGGRKVLAQAKPASSGLERPTETVIARPPDVPPPRAATPETPSETPEDE